MWYTISIDTNTGVFILAKNKSLTIGNTDRYFNIHLKHRNELDNFVKVTRRNENKIEREMDLLIDKSKRYTIRDDKKYLLFNEKYNNDRLIDKLTKHSGEMRFYTNGNAPYYVVKGLANHKKSSIVYNLRKGFTQQEIENISLSFMATKVIVDVPIIIPDINPYEVLDSLSYIKTNVDEVHVSFPRLKKIRPDQEFYYDFDGEFYDIKPSEKIKYTEYLRASLSIWKMYLYVIANTDSDYKELDTIIEFMRSKRNTGKKKVNNNGNDK